MNKNCVIVDYNLLLNDYKNVLKLVEGDNLILVTMNHNPNLIENEGLNSLLLKANPYNRNCSLNVITSICKHLLTNDILSEIKDSNYISTFYLNNISNCFKNLELLNDKYIYCIFGQRIEQKQSLIFNDYNNYYKFEFNNTKSKYEI